MRSYLVIFFFVASISIYAQVTDKISALDRMLLQGKYQNVIDSCRKTLVKDSLNAELYFKMGMALQNTLAEDEALSAFKKAVSLDSSSTNYKYILAKGYYSKSKNKLAEPILANLYRNDTLNWTYAFHLTSIYMQNNRFDDAIRIYDRFLKKDTNNVYLDKKGFVMLKKGEYDIATELYEKSLKLKPDNTSAIKNLAFLYTADNRPDTAVYILTEGIGYDPDDMDLYARRAQINYARNYTKRALDDYMVIVGSGDSTELYLRRIGIGYCNNLQQNLAKKYLLLAYRKDSSQSETCSYLGQTYYKLKDLKRSIYYYERVLKLLSPYNLTTRLTYILLAESLKEDRQYKNALNNYNKAQQIKIDPNIYWIMANIYDEQMDDKKNAIRYYQLYLDNLKLAGGTVSLEAIEAIRKRMEFLKGNPVQ